MADEKEKKSFHEKNASERVEAVKARLGLSDDEAALLLSFGGLDRDLVSSFIENAVGVFGLPLGLATNFLVNGRDILVPMAVEETSVVAAASYGAKLARKGGGFTANASSPVMTAEVEVRSARKEQIAKIFAMKTELISELNGAHESLVRRGGGLLDVEVIHIGEIGSHLFLLHIDTCDAMGANIVNSYAEAFGQILRGRFNVEVGLQILTNLTLRRTVEASCFVPMSELKAPGMTEDALALGIEKAYILASHDIMRAATHNKGVMNGIDPVVIATGNDWRAVEAGAHAYAALTGRYQPLTSWVREDGGIRGRIKLPLALGIVGGVTRLHPVAALSLKILGSPSARELCEVVASVGLAQNLSALRALAGEGIQKGHMALHATNLDRQKTDQSGKS